MPTIEIRPGLHMPLLGLGTWEIRGGACTAVVKQALEIGYRHIDTALLYENHRDIAVAIRDFPREELFLCSKVMPHHIDPKNLNTIQERCMQSLDELGIEQLDLFLLHYPSRELPMKEVIRVLTTLPSLGLTAAVGVSNFTQRHLEVVLPADLAINQVEYHPYLNQKELRAMCKAHNIDIAAYRPLGKGALVKDPIFEKIGKKYGKSPAQISLRWLIQQGIPTIPKASSFKHLRENFEIFDFTLDSHDLRILDHLEIQHRFCENQWSDFR